MVQHLSNHPGEMDDLVKAIQLSGSGSSLRSVSNRPASARSTTSRSGAYRHALLKGQAFGRVPVEKDLPVAPVLTRAEFSLSVAQVSERVSEPVIVEDDIHPSLGNQSSHGVHDLLLTKSLGELQTARVQRASTMPNHNAEASVDVSDDTRGYDNATGRLRPPLDATLDDDNHDEYQEGDEHRGLLCQEKLASSAVPSSTGPGSYFHVHPGHSHAAKVKPMVCHESLQATQPSLTAYELRDGHPKASKARSCHNAPIAAFSPGGNLRSKFQLAGPAKFVGTLANEIEEPSEHASYWDLLPILTEKKHKTPDAGGGGENASLVTRIPPSGVDRVAQVRPRMESSPLDSVGVSHDTRSRRNSNSFVSAATKIREAGTPVSAMSRVEKCGSDAASVPASQIQSERQDIAEISEALQPTLKVTTLMEHSTENKRADHLQNHLTAQENYPDSPKTHDLQARMRPNRAGRWLRDLIRYREPRLTQLPEKLHPRHESHDDYPRGIESALVTRVTTFSGKNAEDADAMNQAMSNLEGLLKEALQIANDATERDGGGHIDDGHLHQFLPDDDLSHPPSLHESVLYVSTSEGEGQEDPFVGALEGTRGGCDALPPRLLNRRDPIPDIHSGNIKGPVLPDRESSLRAVQPIGLCKRKRKPQEDTDWHQPSVLPMTHFDNRLHQDCTYLLRYVCVEDDPMNLHTHYATSYIPNSREVSEYIKVFHTPPITHRTSSKNLRRCGRGDTAFEPHIKREVIIRRKEADVCSLDGGASDDVIDFSPPTLASPSIGRRRRGARRLRSSNTQSEHRMKSGSKTTDVQDTSVAKRAHDLRNVSLRGRSHVSIKDSRFNLMKSHRRQPIARDWSSVRKRFVAAVACISTALIGMLVGIYAGLVPSIQYYLADFHHYAIVGNVVMYLGMALPTFFCWPLPLLHGRKPYILSSLAIAMPLLFPQAVAVSTPRSPDTSIWRWALLLSRGLMGVSLGFASMNFHSILTDLFGASLMSSKPHQELVNNYDVRRHGGGLGVWLGIWTWCFIGSLSLGFLIGALVINTLEPSWGLYISIMVIAVVTILNVLTPEVRRSAWRRSVAEVRTGEGRVSRRVARGEVMMHRVQDGPKWWGQECYHGVALSLEMLRQPGFAVMAIYSAWIYAQVVLIIVVS
jgi:hypothetical protein